MLNRRSLITGLVSFVAAPAIVKVSSLMPVKPYNDSVYPIWIYKEFFIYDDYHFYRGVQWSEKIIKRAVRPLINAIPESYK